MFDLTHQEKIIIIFLTSAFILGLGINSYKKSHAEVRLSVESYEDKAKIKDLDAVTSRWSLVNINSLDTEELSRLSGIGKVLAREIVQYHKIHGPFTLKEDLMRVKGIGEKKFEKIKDLIVLE